MLSIITRFILYGILLPCCFRMSMTCSCFIYRRVHMQNLFCSKKFLFLGRVYREEVVDGFLFERVKYSVKVIKPYKGSLEMGETFDIYTGSGSESCAIKIKNGTVRYFMTDDDKTISPCDSEGSPRTFRQWLYVVSKGRYSYAANCRCKVKDDMYQNPDGRQSCKYDINNRPLHRCYTDLALCVWNGDRCVWDNELSCKQLSQQKQLTLMN